MKLTRRDVTTSVAAMIVLPKAAFSRTMTDLRSLRIPGVEAFAYRDESTLPLNQATTALADTFKARGAQGGVDGQTLAADATTTDDAIAKSVDALLGSDWQRSKGFASANPAIRQMVWESKSAPQRFYAIAAFNAVHTATDGRKYRPLESVFTRAR